MNRIWTLLFTFILCTQFSFAQSGLFIAPNSSPITSPITGRSWLFNSSNNTIAVWNGSTFQAVNAPFSNYLATNNPTSSNDSTQGYVVGSIWLNQTTQTIYTCFSNTTSAAVWVLTNAPVSVPLANLQQDGATTGQVIKWNGSTWAPGSLTSGTVTTTGTPASGNITQFSGATSITNGNLSGDVTTSGTLATTLATVNTNTGSFGSSTAIPSFTVNGKGLLTAASTNAVIAPAGTLTGTTLASNVVTSSLTTTGTIDTGIWQGSPINLASYATGILPTTSMPALTGDVTTSSGTVATTLATVNSNVGSFTNANITVNAKGLVTAAANGAGGAAVNINNANLISSGNALIPTTQQPILPANGILQPMPPGTGYSVGPIQAFSNYQNVQGGTATPDGNVWITGADGTERIFKINPVNMTSTPYTIASAYNASNLVYSNEFLYGFHSPSTDTPLYLDKISLSGSITTTSVSGAAASFEPGACAVDQSGNYLWVFDNNHGQLYKVSISGSSAVTVGSSSLDASGLSTIANSPDGKLWAVGQTSGSLFIIDPVADTITTVSLSGLSASGITNIVFAPDGYAYLSNQASPSTLYKVAITAPATAIASYSFGVQVYNAGGTMGADGNIYLGDYNNSYIWQFSPSLGILTNITGSASVINPQSMIAAPDGSVIVVGTLDNTGGTINKIPLVNNAVATNKVIGGTTLPGIAGGSGAGTSPTVSVTGTDVAGQITVTTDSSPTASAVICTLTFVNPYGTAPYVVFSPANANSDVLSGVSGVYVNTTKTTFTLNAGTTALAGTTTYIWHYHVIQ